MMDRTSLIMNCAFYFHIYEMIGPINISVSLTSQRLNKRNQRPDASVPSWIRCIDTRHQQMWNKTNISIKIRSYDSTVIPEVLHSTTWVNLKKTIFCIMYE